MPGSMLPFGPTYPGQLYDFIFRHLNHFTTAWDAGTGNGQVARDLARKFTSVMATDISPQQLKNAYPADNIFYSLAAEETPFPGKTFDLITVAQAIHWFDVNKFYARSQACGKTKCRIGRVGIRIDQHCSGNRFPFTTFLHGSSRPLLGQRAQAHR